MIIIKARVKHLATKCKLMNKRTGTIPRYKKASWSIEKKENLL